MMADSAMLMIKAIRNTTCLGDNGLVFLAANKALARDESAINQK